MKPYSLLSCSNGTQLTSEDLALLNQALDDLLDAVHNDPLPFLGTHGERKGMVHIAFHDLFKAMQRRRGCCYPDCVNMSISKSHSLQKKGPLAFIAEDSHVITPSFARNGSGYIPILVGVNKASTFPGFCPDHEAIFDFEHLGELITDRDIELQVFRTICREVTVKQIHVEFLRNERQRHNVLLSERGMEFLKHRLDKAFLSRHGLTKLTLNHVSNAEAILEQCEEEVTAPLSCLKNEFLPAAVEDIEGKGNGLYHVAVTVEQPLPVCLAGLANFWINDHGRVESVRTILNVIPSAAKTIIVATCLARCKAYLNCYMQSMLNRMNGVLIMVETWMGRGTDNWFITPSVWKNIPETRRAVIMKDLYDEFVSIGEPYASSVLDSLRLQTLESVDAKTEPQEVYNVETSKISDRSQDQHGAQQI